MALSLDDFESSARKGPRCSVGALLAELPPPDRDLLAGILEDRQVTATAIQRGLAKNGHRLGDTTIARHRRGLCLCGR